MDIITMALAICLETTTLDCENIPVEVTKLEQGVAGQAILYKSGNMKIELNKDNVTNTTTKKIRELITHEYAHLVTYTQGNLKSPHGRDFRKNCNDMANSIGVSLIQACSGHANH